MEARALLLKNKAAIVLTCRLLLTLGGQKTIQATIALLGRQSGV